MANKRGIQLRRCSLCGKTGHNRAKCLLYVKEKISKNKIEIKSKKGLVEKKNSVIGNHGLIKNIGINNSVDKRILSPHVVNLKKSSEINKVWDEVSVFSERSLPKKEIKVVDFAEMIRENNKKQQSKMQHDISKDQDDFDYDLDNLVSRSRKNKEEILEKIKFKLPSIKIPQVEVTKYLDVAKVSLQQFFSKFTFKKLLPLTICFIIILGLPFPSVAYYKKIKQNSNEIVDASTNAFLLLQSSAVAAFHADLDSAKLDLNSSLENFDRAKNIIEKEDKAVIYLASLLPFMGDEIRSRQDLLNAGHYLAIGNTYLLKGISETEKQDTLTNKIDILHKHLGGVISNYQYALEELVAIDNSAVPVEYQKSFSEFKLLFAALINDLKDLDRLSVGMLDVFGSDELKKYLIVFQNNDELRPTGGFMGSFAELYIQKGKITKMEIPAGGSYDLQGQLNTFIKPPLPLQLANSRWEFQDANWFPDFPATAKKIEWFYENSRNTTLDGVIAVNASVLSRFLNVMGTGVVDASLGLDSTNTIQSLQYTVEFGPDKKNNKPKQILENMALSFMDNMKSVDRMQIIKLLAELHESLEQKEIQIYFNDASVENKFKSFGWTGEIVQTPPNQDYLFVVNSNIGGQKSDARINQEIVHQTEILDSGEIIDTVLIRKKHTSLFEEPLYGVTNIDFVRVYVPEGSELLEAGGFSYPPENMFSVPNEYFKDDVDLLNYEKEISVHPQTGTRITNEFGKTSFGNWTITAVGGESEIYFRYKLPFTLDLNQDENKNIFLKEIVSALSIKDNPAIKYSLYVQKQSGINSKFQSTIIFPVSWTPVWKSSDDIGLAYNGSVYNSLLLKDNFMGIVAQKNN